jgi:hypothetical protein|tara:strand:+ start:63 stop:284 length:222 start_codon:yes stop_codon:yes gene_type:complete
MKVAHNIGKWTSTSADAKASISARMKMAVSASERQRNVKKISLSPTPWDKPAVTLDSDFSNQVTSVTLKSGAR